MIKRFTDKPLGVLIVAGVAPKATFLKATLVKLSYHKLYVADGGANALFNTGILPDKLVGDLDSINEDVKAFYVSKGVEVKKFPKEKDFSDTELAVNYLIEDGCEEIIIFGALGGRQDHHFANALLLMAYGRKGIILHLVDEGNVITYVSKGQYHVDKKESTYLSFFALNDKGMTLSLDGVYYPLERHNLNLGATLCLSNQVTSEQAVITIHDGDGYMIMSKERV